MIQPEREKVVRLDVALKAAVGTKGMHKPSRQIAPWPPCVKRYALKPELGADAMSAL